MYNTRNNGERGVYEIKKDCNIIYFFDIDFVLDNKFLGLIFFLISILLFLCGNFLEIISVYFKQSFEMYLRLLRRKHDEE